MIPKWRKKYSRKKYSVRSAPNICRQTCISNHKEIPACTYKQHLDKTCESVTRVSCLQSFNAHIWQSTRTSFSFDPCQTNFVQRVTFLWSFRMQFKGKMRPHPSFCDRDMILFFTSFFWKLKEVVTLYFRSKIWKPLLCTLKPLLHGST